MNRIHSLVLCLLVTWLTSASLAAKDLPVAKPESVSMSSEKLAEVDRTMEKLVREKRLAGAVVMVARRGKVVHLKPYGMMDLEAQKPMRTDTIVRIYSMSKAIVSSAAMMLVDQGKIGLDDPVSKYIPEFKSLKVHKLGGDIAPRREMTVRDLLRHTSGLTYGFFGDTPVDKKYRAANVLDRRSSLKTMGEKLGKLPLLYEPGTDWTYSVSVDVLGRVIEVATEQPLDQFLTQRIFKPLNMRDTGFHVPRDKLDRFAANYTSDGKGNLTLLDAPATSRYRKPPGLFSGGGGLVSTAEDYMRFLLMIAGNGEFQGKRLLSKKSVRLMTTNQLPKKVGWIKFGSAVRQGVGFGLGFSVRVEDSKWDPGGRVGEYGWGGAASTHFWVSPKEELTVVTLEQIMPYSFNTEFAVKGLIYDAIEK